MASIEASTALRAIGAELDRSASFGALPPEQQAAMRENLDKVLSYLAGPAAPGTPDPRPGVPPRATALADGIEKLKSRLGDKQQLVGAEFKTGAVKQGIEGFGELVGKVDFPAFVGGLIHNVFQAIVDASIQQMRAYSELLAATAKTVDQFAQDHITDSQTRDYVANRFPGAVKIEAEGDAPPRLRPSGNGELDVGREFGLEGVDLSDDEGERAVVAKARLEMARSRQQQLATMVLLGVNRIVVTNGHINAKVVFDMRASDEAKRRAKAELQDRESAKQSIGGSFWGTSFNLSHEHQTTVSSAVDDTSQAKAEVKAQLTGEVRVAFKSETFPLERMVDVMGLQQLNAKAAPGGGAPASPSKAPAATAPPAGGSR